MERTIECPKCATQTLAVLIRVGLMTLTASKKQWKGSCPICGYTAILPEDYFDEVKSNPNLKVEREIDLMVEIAMMNMESIIAPTNKADVECHVKIAIRKAMDYVQDHPDEFDLLTQDEAPEWVFDHGH